MSDEVKIQELDPPTEELLAGLYKDPLSFARFGDIGCLMPRSYKEDAENIKTIAVRPDDVWVVTFPRSGTTWTQELVWLLMNDLDYETAAKSRLLRRYFFLEVKHVFHIDQIKLTLDPKISEEVAKSMPPFEIIVNAPSPRFFKTHMPFSLLPQNLLDTTKVVYLARDPRDVAVSFYHHNRLVYRYSGDFKSYWNLFLRELVMYCPFFTHLKEAWALRHHPNMLFIFYEDMTKDLASSIKRIANFFDKELTEEQIVRLCDHLDIKNFRKNESVNPSMLKQFNPDAEGFVRKGKSGAWREHFDEEMAAQAQRWMRENLAGTDLRFPDNSSNVATLISLCVAIFRLHRETLAIMYNGKPGAWREQFDEEMTAQTQRWMDENIASSDLRFPGHTS